MNEVFAPVAMPETMNHLRITEFASQQAVLRRYLDSHRAWIEHHLGCRMEEALLLEFDNFDISFAQLAVEGLFRSSWETADQDRRVAQLQKQVVAVEYSSYLVPSLKVEEVRDPRSHFAQPKKLLRLKVKEVLAVLRFHGQDFAVIAARIPRAQGMPGDTDRYCDRVLVRHNAAAPFFQFLQNEPKEQCKPHLCAWGSRPQPIPPCCWEDLVLHPSIDSLVRRDFASFFARESWFRRHWLPFRRGYLFDSPPGNGKTTFLRAMLSTSGLEGHAIPLWSDRTDDASIDHFFHYVANRAPAIIVLEDLDRAFPRTLSAAVPTKVSLSQLLNCLDRLGTQEDLIVIATANDPTQLDPAILQRRGRFDRVVGFSAPD